jgi:hypothetical protein
MLKDPGRELVHFVGDRPNYIMVRDCSPRQSSWDPDKELVRFDPELYFVNLNLKEVVSCFVDSALGVLGI